MKNIEDGAPDPKVPEFGSFCDLAGDRQDDEFWMKDELEETYSNRVRKKLRRQIKFCIQHDLTPRQRQMMLMYYDKKMTMEQIGRQLGVNRSAVCRTLARARKRLMFLLRPYFED